MQRYPADDSDRFHKPAVEARAEVAATEAETRGPDVGSKDDARAATIPPDRLLQQLLDRFPDCGWAISLGQRVAVVPRDGLVAVSEYLRDDQGFSMCVDLTAADYLEQWDRLMGTWEGGPTRYEVVVNLLDLGSATPPHLLPEGEEPDGRPPRRIRLRVPIDEDDLHCPTLSFTWALCDSAEREVYDMFGIVFDRHPDLSRILMPDEWEGHPLRKDYAIGRVPVQFHGDEEPPPTPVTLRTRSGGPPIRFKGGSGAAPTEKESPR